MNRVYICIDLKSFYASVECTKRNLDPLKTHLVVADESRTDKTICLAISPSLKKYGLGGRARLFEVKQKIKKINGERKRKNDNLKLRRKSYFIDELEQNSSLEVDYIIAPPRMKLYIEYSAKIYQIYLKYLAPEDIYVYSIDEVFCDITDYLNIYNMSPKELVKMIIREVYEQTGITATAGIGPNLYLCKVAMDIVAKHMEPDQYGGCIAQLDEIQYRKLLWQHKPLTDFWRIGQGYFNILSQYQLFTMGDIARCSLENEELLYRLFGVNAELLIDHAWGYEPCTLKDIRSYKPMNTSISSGQVLKEAYDFKKTAIIVREMVDLLVLELVRKKLVTQEIVLTIGYDVCNCKGKENYDGEITTDLYGRNTPKHAHGTIHLDYKTSSIQLIMKKAEELFVRIMDPKLVARRINLTFTKVEPEENCKKQRIYQQFDLFSNPEEMEQTKLKELSNQKDERKLQEIILKIKDKYGKNAILKGMDLEEGATTRKRNMQIGGHQA